MTPWTAAHQVPLSVRFFRQGYWSELPFPSPGDLPNPGIEPRSPALQADSLPPELPGKPPQYSNLKQSVSCKAMSPGKRPGPNREQSKGLEVVSATPSNTEATGGLSVQINSNFGPITSWQIDGETMETLAGFISLGSITTDGDCSHEIQRRSLLGRKATTNLDSML